MKSGHKVSWKPICSLICVFLNKATLKFEVLCVFCRKTNYDTVFYYWSVRKHWSEELLILWIVFVSLTSFKNYSSRNTILVCTRRESTFSCDNVTSTCQYNCRSYAGRVRTEMKYFAIFQVLSSSDGVIRHGR